MLNIRKIPEKAWLILLFAFLSFAVLLFAVQSSPFYPINDWVDPNCFLTVGKAIADGKVLYRDIYEQKGPYLYFLHALCTLVFPDSFLGVWFMEAALCFVMLFFVYKILKLYGIDDFKRVAAVSTLIVLGVYFSFAMSKGDSVEEICSPFLLSVVYITLRRVKRGEKFGVFDYLYIGLVAGFVFWSKFTIVGFFIAWYVFFLYFTIKDRKWKDLGVGTAVIAFGVVAATLPCFVYFSVNHAVKDWLKVYLYDNIFLYGEGGSIFLRVGKMLLCIAGTLAANLPYTFFVVLGMVCFSKKRFGKGVEERLFLLIVPIVTACFLYIGGRGYRYYGLPLSIFSVFGYIAVAESGISFGKRSRKALVSAAALLCCTVFMFINGNFSDIFRKKEDTVQYKFAKVIEEKEGAALLDYGYLDGGFYLAAKQVPKFKYFCRLNMPLPEMEAEMRRYIEDREADFVVVKLWKNNKEELDSPDYEEVMRVDGRSFWEKETYILYALKGEMQK